MLLDRINKKTFQIRSARIGSVSASNEASVTVGVAARGMPGSEIVWALLLKGQRDGGQSGQSRVIWPSASATCYFFGQVRYGRGRKGKRKCWKQSLVCITITIIITMTMTITITIIHTTAVTITITITITITMTYTTTLLLYKCWKQSLDCGFEGA